MALKILGVIFIVFSSSVIGYYFSKLDSYRAEDLDEMKRGIYMLKAAIAFSAMPLYEAFIDISGKLSGSVAEIFEDAGRAMKKKQGDSANAIWSEMLLKNINRTYFTNEDLNSLFAFGRALGYMDRQQQLNNADILIEYLKETSQRLISKNIKEGRLYRSMGLLCGILLSVVLF